MTGPDQPACRDPTEPAPARPARMTVLPSAPCRSVFVASVNVIVFAAPGDGVLCPARRSMKLGAATAIAGGAPDPDMDDRFLAARVTRPLAEMAGG